MPPLLDEEMRVLVLKKTWCHGQLLAPIWAIVCLWLYIGDRYWQLLPSIIFLPIWSWRSWQSVARPESQQARYRLLIMAAAVELAHGLVFSVAAGLASQSTRWMLATIASALFAVETLAFMLVLTNLQPAQQPGESVYENLDVL